MSQVKLSQEEIKNWRKILCITIGGYALIMSDSEVQNMKDEYQQKVNIETTRLADKSRE